MSSKCSETGMADKMVYETSIHYDRDNLCEQRQN